MQQTTTTTTTATKTTNKRRIILYIIKTRIECVKQCDAINEAAFVLAFSGVAVYFFFFFITFFRKDYQNTFNIELTHMLS